MRPSRLLVRFVAMAAVMAGCAEPFPPANRLTDLQILAIRADAPWLAAGATATVDALVYSPRTTAPTFAWSWCPVRGDATAGYACAITAGAFEAQLRAVGDVTTAVSYDLGTGATAQLPYLSTPALLAALCDAAAAAATAATATVTAPTAPAAQCRNGYTVSIGLVVHDGTRSVRGYKTLTLLLDGKLAPNTNPTIREIAYQGAERAALGTAEAPSNLVQAGYPLHADIPATSAEWTTAPAQRAAPASFAPGGTGATGPGAVTGSTTGTSTPTTDTTQPPPTPGAQGGGGLERLAASWYVTAGSTALLAGAATAPTEWGNLTANRWELGDAPPGEHDLYLVVRDNRGGVTWVRKTVRVQP
jgi:hypothetical protein